MSDQRIRYEIEAHIHFHDHSHSAALEVKIDRILHLQEKLMTVAQDLKQELVEINATTNEIATDIDDLVAKVGVGGLSPAEADELKTQLGQLKQRLTGIAAVHTPESVPPVEVPPDGSVPPADGGISNFGKQSSR